MSYFNPPGEGKKRISTYYDSFPYKATSPTLKTNIVWNETEIWNEFDRICEEAEDSKWSVGQSLYYQIPLFAKLDLFMDDEFQEYIREYMMVKKFNIPIAKSLDEVEWPRYKYFEFIDEEINACMKRQKKLKESK